MQQPELHGREGGPERGDRLGESVLVRHQAVDVALDDEGAVLGADGFPRRVGGIQHVALRVERRLGRVEVFRLLVAESTPPEGDDAALEIADGEGQPPAETIVDTGAALALDDEARAEEHVVAHVLPVHEVAKLVPSLGGIAEREPTRDFRIDAASLEIRARLLAAGLAECLDVEPRRELHRAEELFAPRVARGPLLR